jgi:hypothetical protein
MPLGASPASEGGLAGREPRSMSPSVALTGNEAIAIGRRLIGAIEAQMLATDPAREPFALVVLQAERAEVGKAKRRLRDCGRSAISWTARLRAGRSGMEQRKAAAARAGVVEKGLKRSKLTPLEKSRIIQEVGGQAYLALPWD